ncbi:hypothetical protein HN954_00515 [bacterium]|jgi:hypothetical protein|nr:hypothetical protein [bacterium]MBT6831602.1 hypothetical protein [bacterium]MBT6995897.1 hypothetical protein [bacterium]MBT7772671.1 hypothetical protein [bacterium]
MPKDPEKFGGMDSISEDLDDLIVGALALDKKYLKVLMLFFKEMFEIAKPFTNLESKKITAPGGKLPVDGIDPRMIQMINKIDGAFIETIRMTEWIIAFSEGYNRCKKKLAEEGNN